MKILSFILGVALASAGSACLAQWQWLDKDGRKVFSDRSPPSDIPEKNILKRPAGTATTATTAPAPSAKVPEAAPGKPLPLNMQDKELEAKKKQAEEAEIAKRKAAEEALTRARMENCAIAKQAKATLDSGVRMARTNASGETEIMDDAARAAEAKRIQATINSDCR